MNPNQKQAVLVLSHQGFSFLEEICPKVRSQGYEVCLLSSEPSELQSHRKLQLKKDYPLHIFSGRPALDQASIDRAILSFRKQGVDLVYCVGVWEAYRPLMARANETLGACDLSESTCRLLTDKLAFRKRLLGLGLSDIQVNLLNESNFEDARSKACFAKPRFGLGSFGAHRLQENESWSDLETVRHAMRTDSEYQSVFRSDELIVEDFIPGSECSFELMAEEGGLQFFATHEKAKLDQRGASTLEEICVAPPISLSGKQIEAGKRFIQKVFSQLGVSRGCFHVEAKCDGQKWEIVEFNPRVGGALIKESVRVLSGACLVQAWLDQLAGRSYQTPRHEKSEKSTYFRVYFGKSGQQIKSCRQKKIEMEPVISSLAVQRGHRFSSSPKEGFLGQALWSSDRAWTPDQLNRLNTQSGRLFEVTYER